MGGGRRSKSTTHTTHAQTNHTLACLLSCAQLNNTVLHPNASKHTNTPHTQTPRTQLGDDALRKVARRVAEAQEDLPLQRREQGEQLLDRAHQVVGRAGGAGAGGGAHLCFLFVRFFFVREVLEEGRKSNRARAAKQTQRRTQTAALVALAVIIVELVIVALPIIDIVSAAPLLAATAAPLAPAGHNVKDQPLIVTVFLFSVVFLFRGVCCL